VSGGTESLVEDEGEGKEEPLSAPPVCKGTSSASEAITQTETDEEKGCVYGLMCVRVCECVLSQYRNKTVTLKTYCSYRGKKGAFPDTRRQACKIAKWPPEAKPL
jgi:hypothetical protein